MEDTLTSLTEELIAVREARAELEREAKEGKEYEEEIRHKILNLMEQQNLEAFRTGDAQITRRVSQKARLEDYDTLIEYIQATGSFDLLQKRVAERAVTDRWEQGIVVPGVSAYSEMVLTVRSV